MKAVILGCLAATVLWLIMFSPWTAGGVNFWIMMPLASGGLAVAATIVAGPELKGLLKFRPVYIAAGVASAIALYGAFFVGHNLVARVWGAAGDQIESIYELRQSAPLWIIATVLLFVAAAEELFWRGFVQNRLMKRFGRWGGFALATGVYGAIHLWSLNPMLAAAAVLCGIVWGWLLLRFGSLWPGLVSHVVWDILIFVLIPTSVW